MQTSQKHKSSAGIHGFYHQPQEIDQYGLPHIQILDNNVFSDVGNQGTTVSFQNYKDEYFTLESSTATGGFVVYDSPAASVSSNRSPFSPQGSHSYLSDPHHSPDNIYGSPMSGSSSADDDNLLMRQKLRELEFLLLGSESDITKNCDFCFHQADRLASWDWNQMVEMIPRLDIKQVLFACAQSVSDGDIQRAAGLMHVLEQMVSVSGEPMQRLGAYMLEGLRARVELSGSKIYRALKCDAPLSSDLMTYMGILLRSVPTGGHPVDVLNQVTCRSARWPPSIRITGVDDPQSAHARGGGLPIVGHKLSCFAESCNVPFEFYDAAMSGCEVQLEHLGLQPGEAVVVNFPYVLHHMPDESVNTWNHRDRLLRLVKSLSPKVVTLIEQESNTNTKPFLPRFKATLEYYAAMFESIDAGSSRDDKQRINAEQHCVARDIVNMIACEGADRVERHELFGKWSLRFNMAGFTQYPLTSMVTGAVRDLLREYDRNYGLQEKDGALYLWWINTPMATFSAWR
ncbi:hypothetical protein GH714_010426 [Hevea brasiliensis]|uniref:Uncharacterized protein n=1 Tax=Hevea brasiliensis TaxID=3981 RepID=A0A6A6M283_HEVBR|nr:hypothetical protein GH714_010426 [Hevea brasiliensis]